MRPQELCMFTVASQVSLFAVNVLMKMLSFQNSLFLLRSMWKLVKAWEY